jgi:molybdate transport system substrate-binding protein
MRVRGLAAAALGVLVLAGCTSPQAPQAVAGTTVVRVAAAADLKFALEEVKTALTAAHPDLDLAVTYGSSGTFFQQISNGAPFDIYLSADLSYPRKLVEAGKADNADLFGYAVGRLVVWAPHDSPVDPTGGLAVLAQPAAAKVAIANPDHAPYGVAAVAAMRSAGVYDAVQPKLVLGENVAQAAEFAQSGNAQAGVIALSLALSPQMSDKGRYSEVPLDSFPRIDQGGAVLASAADLPAARAVKDFLLGEQGRAILKRYGFYPPAS